MKVHAKKHKKMHRKLPKFKPLPESVSKLREFFASIKTYARFYGDYVSPLGKTRRFSFQVLFDSDLSGSEKYQVVLTVCNAILRNQIPTHKPGQVFTLHELLHHIDWIPVRKILQYKVGMAYV